MTSFAATDAIATLRNSGFKVVVEVVDTQDPTQDGIVLHTDPGPGQTSAKPGTTVTITVGHYVAPPTTTTAPTTTAPTTDHDADRPPTSRPPTPTTTP